MLVFSIKWESKSIIPDAIVRKVPVCDGISVADCAGILSVASYSAYYGLVVVGKPKAGETFLVSSAAGAVGQMAVQLAKARGMRVFGVAGSNEKVEYVKSLGADDAFNYKTCGNYTEAIRRHCPNGVDVYFDNVGGEFLEAVLENINVLGRIIACGIISQYNVNSPKDRHGIKNAFNLISKRVAIQRFLISDHIGSEIEGAFINEASSLCKGGKIKYKLHENLGLESAPQAFIGLLDGKNFGKSVIKI